MKPYYSESGITIFHGDCREVLPNIGMADAVITDPPYVFGIASTAQEGKAGGWGDLMNSSIWYESWLEQCKRVTRGSQGCCWVFNSWRSFPVLARAAYGVQWPIESLLVWDKCWIGPGGTKGLRPSYELIALFAQNTFAIPDRGLPDIWRSQWSSLKPNGHPAEKPVDLLNKPNLAVEIDISRAIKEMGERGFTESQVRDSIERFGWCGSIHDGMGHYVDSGFPFPTERHAPVDFRNWERSQ